MVELIWSRASTKKYTSAQVKRLVRQLKHSYQNGEKIKEYADKSQQKEWKQAEQDLEKQLLSLTTS